MQKSFWIALLILGVCFPSLGAFEAVCIWGLSFYTPINPVRHTTFELARTALREGDRLRAAGEFAKVGQPLKAAELYREEGRLIESAELLRKAAELFRANKIEAEASALFGEIKKIENERSESTLAAESAGRYEEAALGYLAAGQIRQAAALYKRADKPEIAERLLSKFSDADTWAEILIQQGKADEVAREILRLAKGQSSSSRLRDLYRESPDTFPPLLENALEQLKTENKFELATRLREASPLASDREANNLLVARDYQALGLHEESARAYSRANRTVEAGREYFAARQFENAGEHFWAAGDFPNAEKAFLAAGDVESAARMHRRYDPAGARGVLEAEGDRHLKAGNYQEAIWAFEDAGNKQKAQEAGLRLAHEIARGKLASIGPLGGGVRDTYLMTLDNGLAGVFVPAGDAGVGPGTSHGRDIAVSELAELMGRHFVRRTMSKTIETSLGQKITGTFSVYLDRAKDLSDKVLPIGSEPDLEAFNWLTRDVDRSRYNHMVCHGRTFGIDYDYALNSKLIRPALDDDPPQNFSADFLASLKQLTSEIIKERLGSYLLPEDLDLLIARRARLLAFAAARPG